jgi:hypothetical protein
MKGKERKGKKDHLYFFKEEAVFFFLSESGVRKFCCVLFLPIFSASFFFLSEAGVRNFCCVLLLTIFSASFFFFLLRPPV